MNIVMQSSSNDLDSHSSGSRQKLSDLGLHVGNGSTDDYLDSSFDSEAEGDSWELKGHPRDLFELYFVLGNCRYHVDRPISTKTKDFALNHFNSLPSKLFR